jgi:hypothetical protein
VVAQGKITLERPQEIQIYWLGPAK